ncbi:MAG: hypothetical protein HQL33_01805 [Alphaproteobacteria bacterium]|nr:hypothetical protein [Alphaproteobacteria bacterium]MBF0128705.1 hypothetical protein [Alphaproteobacteria bacterium]
MRNGRRLRVLASCAVLAAGPALAEEAGRSGQPLNVYCNTAPEMGVGRADSVDNWVRICSLWLGSQGKPTPKPAKDDAKDDPRSPKPKP